MQKTNMYVSFVIAVRALHSMKNTCLCTTKKGDAKVSKQQYMDKTHYNAIRRDAMIHKTVQIFLLGWRYRIIGPTRIYKLHHNTRYRIDLDPSHSIFLLLRVSTMPFGFPEYALDISERIRKETSGRDNIR